MAGTIVRLPRLCVGNFRALAGLTCRSRSKDPHAHRGRPRSLAPRPRLRHPPVAVALPSPSQRAVTSVSASASAPRADTTCEPSDARNAARQATSHRLTPINTDQKCVQSVCIGVHRWLKESRPAAWRKSVNDPASRTARSMLTR